MREFPDVFCLGTQFFYAGVPGHFSGPVIDNARGVKRRDGTRFTRTNDELTIGHGLQLEYIYICADFVAEMVQHSQ